MSNDEHSTASPALACDGLVGLGKRAQRRNTLLILARNLWYLKLDGIVPDNDWTMNEIDKLLRRAGATRDDL